MRTGRWVWVALALGDAGWAADTPAPPPAVATEIVVTSPRGQASGGIDPLLEISPSELDSYGVDTLSDLVDALRPLTRSSRSDQTAVVLINGHLAGQTEFDNLPREAVERVEVLPESVALQYGFSENQRVLNFILKAHYRSVPMRFTESGATEGGDQAVIAEASRVHLEDEARVTLFASYKDTAWLRESDRGIDLPDSAYRTLQPDTRDTKIAGTVSRSLLGVSASAEASFDVLSTDSLQGLGVDPAGGGTAPAQVLTADAPTRTARIATQLTGQIDDFVWGATAYYTHIAARSSSGTGVDAADAVIVDRTKSALNTGNLQLSLSGRVATLPAGPLIANGKISIQYQGFDTRNATPGLPEATSNLVRTTRSANLNASIPIASRERGVLPALRDLSATLNATLDDVSDFGALASTSIGLDWHPLEKLHLDVIYTDHRAAPTVLQLRAPPVYTANVELYDYLASQTSYVTEVTGGNDTLAATDTRQASVGVSIGPFAGKTEFIAHYEQSRISDAIGALPSTTAAVQAAFPERFVRDGTGTLIEVDDRWVNLVRERSDDLKWGFNVWIPLGDSTPHSMPNRVEFSLFDTWYLHDTTLIRSGVPVLDLLDGAPSDVTGGQPRHKVEFHTLVHQNGFGILLAAAWRSATVVDSGSATTPEPINFSALGTADLRLFGDLEHLPFTQGHDWAKGARIALAVTNLFDRRQAVRNEDGSTPAAFEPGYLDPPGRVIALTLRKVF